MKTEDTASSTLRRITPMVHPDMVKPKSKFPAYLLIAVFGGLLGCVVGGPDWFIPSCVAGFGLGYLLLNREV